jgi:hypothetical protein
LWRNFGRRLEDVLDRETLFSENRLILRIHRGEEPALELCSWEGDPKNTIEWGSLHCKFKPLAPTIAVEKDEKVRAHIDRSSSIVNKLANGRVEFDIRRRVG